MMAGQPAAMHHEARSGPIPLGALDAPSSKRSTRAGPRRLRPGKERDRCLQDLCIQDLFRRYRTSGDRELRNHLVEHHRHLAEHHARRFRGRGEPDADLSQVALLALLKAVERYDPDYGVAFATFAEPTILGELRRHFRDTTWPLHVSRRGQELHLALTRTREQVTNELGRAPTTAELAAAMGVSIDDVLHAVEAANAYRTAPIDTCRTLTDGGYSGADTRLSLDAALEALTPRDRRIIHLRFTAGLTQAEIAQRVGISQVHVSRVLRAALAVLRDQLGHTDKT